MTNNTLKLTTQIGVGTAQIALMNVRLHPDFTVDEIRLDGSDIVVTPTDSSIDPVMIAAGETRVYAMMSEANINAMLANALPNDGLIRNIRLALLSGKVRISGQLAKSVVHLPFTVEAVPLIENGVRIRLDIQAARTGFALPAVLFDALEQWINNNPDIPLDLSQLPVPVKLDEIRCEPGRLIVRARARLAWPMTGATVTLAPFAAGTLPAPPAATPTESIADSPPVLILPPA